MSSELPSDPERLLAYLSENEVADGLPVIPPTEDRVEETIAATPRDPGEVLLEIPTSFAELTVSSLARCAVLAGCKPEYFPGVVAAFEALSEWDNLDAPMATTSGFAIASIVNGPVREDWNLNSGTGLFGPGYRANATIGRAINLAFMIVGETFPGTGTMATHTHPGRYTYCFGENEAVSPWEPLHSDIADVPAGESAVTVLAAQAPKLAGESHNTSAEEVLDELAAGAVGAAASEFPFDGETVFVLSADHATRLEDYGKDEVKRALYERCESEGDSPLRSPEDAIVVVAGGIGNYSSIILTWFEGTQATTATIDRVDEISGER